MERKRAEELYGKILSCTKEIRKEIMNEVADAISFGGVMSEDDARELQNAARITGCVFDALIKRGVPVEPVEGKEEMVRIKLNEGDFVCSKKVMGIHESQTPVVKTNIIKNETPATPASVPEERKPIFQPQNKVEEKKVETKQVLETPVMKEERGAVAKPVSEAETDAAFVNSPWNVAARKEESKKPELPEEEEDIFDDESFSFTPGEQSPSFPGEEEKDVFTEPEPDQVPVQQPKSPLFVEPNYVEEEVKKDDDDFNDEHRKHEDMFIFNTYRVSVSHANSMQSEEMNINIAPLIDYKGSPVFSVPIIVSVFYKGKMVNKSTYEMGDGKTMVQIGIGDFYFLCRGEFLEDGLFKSTIATTGASADNGDILNVLSCDRYGQPHNTGANHIRFRYVVDADEGEIGVIEVFPVDLGEPEFIVMTRSNNNEYIDYYYITKNNFVGNGKETVPIYENNEKKELVVNWDKKFMEAELLEV